MGKKATSRRSTVASSSKQPEIRPDQQIVAFDFSLFSDSTSENLHCISIVKDFPTSPNVPDSALVCTSIPASPKDNLGSSQCVLYQRTREKLLKLDNFGRPPPKLSNKPLFTVENGSSCGKARMIAEKKFDIGDLILLERPMMVVPLDGDHSGVPKCPKQICEAVKSEKAPRCLLEPTIKAAFDRMTVENKEAFMSLRNVREGEAYETCNIWGTNLFDIPELGRLDSEDDEETYSMVFNNISKINHSCRANCALVFDLPSFTMAVSATTDIQPGEEILYDYLLDPIDLPLASQRQELLKCAGLTCSCDSCVSQQSDSERLSIQSELHDLNASYNSVQWDNLDSVTAHYLKYEHWLLRFQKEAHRGGKTFVINFERFVQLGTSRCDLADLAGIEGDDDIEILRSNLVLFTWKIHMLCKAVYGIFSESHQNITQQLPLPVM